MERHHKLRKQPALNLVSLMDIFTILVFFLLVNSSSSQQLPSAKDLKLPTSVAKKAPEETLVIAVTPVDILVQGRRIIGVDAALADTDEVIQSLKTELELQGSRSVLARNLGAEGRAITIMGDENIPYQLVRKIMKTCQQANYTKIAFAANQIAKSKLNGESQ
jgi:Biopolymer transport protein